MKLHADISGTKHEVEINRTDDSVHAVVDGREYTLDVSQPEPGLYVLRDGSKMSVAFVSNLADGTSQVSINGHTIDVKLTDPKRLRGSSVDAEHADGAAEIKTAMPGKVVRILVAQGDAVQKGDGIIVVEAMKMQNEMKSPKDGIISEIRVAESDTVGAGDTLVVIE
ncbi:acetyl-CoA carboxylase biotin carboxyl carrier protein subunit [soil metagenome]